MKKTAHFIVEKRRIILIAFILFTAVCGLLSTQVEVNSDMSKYLPEKSGVKIGAGILSEEFPAANSVFVMFKDVKEGDKESIENQLLTIQHITNVSAEIGTETEGNSGHILFTATMDADGYSPEAKGAVNAIREQFASYDIVLSGAAAGNDALHNLPMIFIPAIIILFIILFIMCNSWFEPILFLVNIGMAVVINMGTNIMFDSVSDITQSIGAILQLVLSMDYSIMLMNRYRQEKALTDNRLTAMKNALGNAFTAISSSSATTIVGMLMLVFMSFTIGMDLGLVLAKGVFFSLLCIFTVLPALILLFDNIIDKTAKPSFHLSMNKLASFAHFGRYAVLAVFVIVFVGGFILRSNVKIDYTMSDFDEVYRVFTPDNPIVVVYENEDEESIAALADKWSKNQHIDSINAYATTLGQKLDYKELAKAAGLDEALAALLYTYYFGEQQALAEQPIVFGEFVRFLQEDIGTNPQFSAFLDQDAMAGLDALTSGQSGEQSVSAEEFALFSGMDAAASSTIFASYFTINGETPDGKIPVNLLVDFIITHIASNEQFAPLFTEEIMAALTAMGGAPETDIVNQSFQSDELAEMLSMEPMIAQQLYVYYHLNRQGMPVGLISLYDFMRFLSTDIAENHGFKPYFDENTLTMLQEAVTEMDEGLVQLKGARFARMIINLNLPEESEETFAFIENIQKDMDEALEGEHYIVGNAAMAYEMSQSFGAELDVITLLTAVSIFLVVAIAFRSMSIPLILVCVIQCAVLVTMGLATVQGNGIFYLPLLIVQCLLMGATIDYGILYTSYYVEARSTKSIKDAITAALNNAIHTIMTSGLILIVVTLTLGLLLAKSDHAISEILLIIAKGSICAAVLVVFVLPSLLAVFDRSFIRRKKQK